MPRMPLDRWSDEDLRAVAEQIVAAEEDRWQAQARQAGWLPPDEIRAKIWQAYLTDRKRSGG